MYSLIEIPAATVFTAARKFMLPTPATDGVSYVLTVENNNTSIFAATITRADGAGVTYSLLAGTQARLRVRPSGVTLDSNTIT